LGAAGARADNGVNVVPDPCAGPGSLLDRTTVGDSACVVKPKKTVVEAGWARYSLYGASGHADGYPQLELRFGLPDNNELMLLPPNINRVVTPAPGGGSLTASGASTSVVGL
jgi:hypothetical protein